MRALSHPGFHGKRTCVLVAIAIAVLLPLRGWAGSPTRTIPAPNVPSGSTSHNASRLMVMIDLNRGGAPDMVEASSPAGNNKGHGSLSIALGRADGSFEAAKSQAVLGPRPSAIVSGDFNHDGIPDVIVGDDDGTLQLFLGDGKGHLTPAGEIGHLRSVVSIAVGDFNHDGNLDIAVSDWRSSTVTVFLGTGNGSFQSGWSSPLRMGGTAPTVVAADFNGDGNPDIAVVYGDDDGYTYDVMVGDGKGSFTSAPKLSFFQDPISHCAS